MRTKVLGLGLSPLSSLANDRFHAVPLIKRLFSVMHRHANFIYSFEGLEFHKKRYSGTERPVYVASTNSNIILQLRDLIAVIMSLGLL